MLRTYELAAIRVAIKRSKRANDIHEGYRYLNNWYQNCIKKNMTANVEAVKGEFKAWVDSQFVIVSA
jgi:hypothetical protein